MIIKVILLGTILLLAACGDDNDTSLNKATTITEFNEQYKDWECPNGYIIMHITYTHTPTICIPYVLATKRWD